MIAPWPGRHHATFTDTSLIVIHGASPGAGGDDDHHPDGAAAAGGASGARGGARLWTCANSMKQLGLAIHSYNATHGCFPPAGIGYGFCCADATYVSDASIHNTSGWIMVLPYLDQSPLYTAFDQTQCASNVLGGRHAAVPQASWPATPSQAATRR